METLVLSAGYEPVARVSWKRAVTLLFAGKVEVVEEYDREIRSVTFSIKVPSVVRFLRMLSGSARRAVKFSRENVYARDGGRCQYCLFRVPRKEATFDHVIPRAQAGHTSWENVVIACVGCNQRKGGRTPEQANMKLGTAPVRPKRLTEAVRLRFQLPTDVPDAWKTFVEMALVDYTYWNGALETDN